MSFTFFLFIASIFSILITNNTVSIIIVLIPTISERIRDAVYESPNILTPKKYPQTNDKNIKVINPKPNAIVNLNSYFSLKAESSSGSKKLDRSFVIA